jgi:hypothetical protein
MKKTALFLIILAAIPLAASAAAPPAESIPDATLRVTTQQKVDGKVTNGFQVFELSCRGGQCSLVSVMLNQCGEAGSGKQGFNPRQQYASTATGNLKARNEGKSIVVQETGSDMIGEFVNNLRFDYEPTDDDRPATRLTGFSGGYVKNAPYLNRVFKFDYVPLPKASQVMKLDCDAVLPGINKK